jgi:hypothetical protein
MLDTYNYLFTLTIAGHIAKNITLKTVTQLLLSGPLLFEWLRMQVRVWMRVSFCFDWGLIGTSGTTDMKSSTFTRTWKRWELIQQIIEFCWANNDVNLFIIVSAHAILRNVYICLLCKRWFYRVCVCMNSRTLSLREKKPKQV